MTFKPGDTARVISIRRMMSCEPEPETDTEVYGIPYTTVLEEIRDDDPFWNFGFTLALEPNLVAAPFEPGTIERALRLYGEVELASAEHAYWIVTQDDLEAV